MVVQVEKCRIVPSIFFSAVMNFDLDSAKSLDLGIPNPLNNTGPNTKLFFFQ